MPDHVYFVTNRKPDRKSKPTDFGGEFGGGTTADLRYGRAGWSKEKGLSIELFDESLIVDKATGRLSKRAKLGSIQAMTGLREQMRDSGRDALVFIHGYNVEFKEAVQALLTVSRGLEAAGTPIIPILFSWPSNGSKLPYIAYSSDRHDAKASGPAFGKAFLKLAEFLGEAQPEEECSQAVHLMAHSMGNYVLRNALQTIKRESASHLSRVFDQVLLMAADEDDDAFEHDHKMAQLPKISRHVTVYFNKWDLALHTSDKTKGNPDRLGTDGPRVPGSLPSRVSQIDCEKVARGLVKHSYYADSKQVIADAAAVLEGEPGDEIQGRTYIEGLRQYRLTPPN